MSTINEQISELYRQLGKLKRERVDEKQEIRKAIWEKEAELEEEFKQSLAHEFSVARGDCFDKAYSIAYQHGHSSGTECVKSYFDDLVDLIRLAQKEQP